MVNFVPQLEAPGLALGSTDGKEKPEVLRKLKRKVN